MNSQKTKILAQKYSRLDSHLRNFEKRSLEKNPTSSLWDYKKSQSLYSKSLAYLYSIFSDANFLSSFFPYRKSFWTLWIIPLGLLIFFQGEKNERKMTSSFFNVNEKESRAFWKETDAECLPQKLELFPAISDLPISDLPQEKTSKLEPSWLSLLNTRLEEEPYISFSSRVHFEKRSHLQDLSLEVLSDFQKSFLRKISDLEKNYPLKDTESNVMESYLRALRLLEDWKMRIFFHNGVSLFSKDSQISEKTLRKLSTTDFPLLHSSIIEERILEAKNSDKNRIRPSVAVISQDFKKQNVFESGLSDLFFRIYGELSLVKSLEEVLQPFEFEGHSLFLNRKKTQNFPQDGSESFSSVRIRKKMHELHLLKAFEKNLNFLKTSNGDFVALKNPASQSVFETSKNSERSEWNEAPYLKSLSFLLSDKILNRQNSLPNHKPEVLKVQQNLTQKRSRFHSGRIETFQQPIKMSSSAFMNSPFKKDKSSILKTEWVKNGQNFRKKEYFIQSKKSAFDFLRPAFLSVGYLRQEPLTSKSLFPENSLRQKPSISAVSEISNGTNFKSNFLRSESIFLKQKTSAFESALKRGLPRVSRKESWSHGLLKTEFGRQNGVLIHNLSPLSRPSLWAKDKNQNFYALDSRSKTLPAFSMEQYKALDPNFLRSFENWLTKRVFHLQRSFAKNRRAVFLDVDFKTNLTLNRSVKTIQKQSGSKFLQSYLFSDFQNSRNTVHSNFGVEKNSFHEKNKGGMLSQSWRNPSIFFRGMGFRMEEKAKSVGDFKSSRKKSTLGSLFKADTFQVFQKNPSKRQKQSFKTKEKQPTTFLSRIGFIYLNQNRSGKWSQNTKKQRIYAHVVEEQKIQRKRRFKKQRRETRRRSKRKRYFPRPNCFRFHMYEKWLKMRHLDSSFSLTTQDPTFSAKSVKKRALLKQIYGFSHRDLKSNPFNSKFLLGLKKAAFIKDPVGFDQGDQVDKLSNLKRILAMEEGVHSHLHSYLQKVERKRADFEKILKRKYWLQTLQWLASYSFGFYSDVEKDLNVHFEKQGSEVHSPFHQKASLSNYTSFQRLLAAKLLDSLKSSSLKQRIAFTNFPAILEEDLKMTKLPLKEVQTFSNLFASVYNFTFQPFFPKTENSLNFSLLKERNSLSAFFPLQWLYEKPEKGNGWKTEDTLRQSLPRLRRSWISGQVHIFPFSQSNSFASLWSHNKQREMRKSNESREMFYERCRSLYPQSLSHLYISKLQNQLQKRSVLGFLPSDLNPSLYESIWVTNPIHPRSFGELPFSSNATSNADRLSSKTKSFSHSVYSQLPKRYWWKSNTDAPFFGFPSLAFEFDFESSSVSRFFQSGSSFLFLSSLLLMIHLSLCLSVLKIPEVRSFMKFSGLILYKLSSHYFMLIHFLFDLSLKYGSEVSKTWTAFEKAKLSFSGSQKFDVVLNDPKPSDFSNAFESTEKVSSQNRVFSEKTRILFQSRIPSLYYTYAPMFSSSQNLKQTLSLLLYDLLKLPYKTSFKRMPSYFSGIKNEKLLIQGRNQQVNPFQLTKKISLGIKSGLSIPFYKVSLISLKTGNRSLALLDSVVLKGIDTLDYLMMFLSKFLEKPAEFMMDWVAQVFLVEWSSDARAYIPEAFEISLAFSNTKYWRSFRILGPVGILAQKRLNSILEFTRETLVRSDADLIMRKQHGFGFWDIWAEILFAAADRYGMNIPSLTFLTDERQLLLERLLKDPEDRWWKNTLEENSALIHFLQSSRPQPFFIHPKAPFEHFMAKKLLFKYGTSPKIFEESLSSYSNLQGFQKFHSLTPTSFHKRDFEKDGSWKQWSVNPSFSYQGNESGLFLQMHPAFSFRNLYYLRDFDQIHAPIANLVCQIYAGLFLQKVSKNLLLIGAPGPMKGLFVRAIAGETEFKMISDHANRYTTVSKGIAIGLKQLRDVFDALALQAPCLFLLEDIHLIGERRPLAISDDENAKGTEPALGFDKEEVHEKNQVIYTLNRHSLFHYRKPYKGDFSLLIPTNAFCFDLFLSPPESRLRRIDRTPSNPLSINFLGGNGDISTQNQSGLSETNLSSTTTNAGNVLGSFLVTKLQVQLAQKLSPPSTSPLTLLLLKENQKLKKRRILDQSPWSGVPSLVNDPAQYSKTSYSIRSKVAGLAHLSFAQMSTKLDTITDLLVIMDSVRANRGFVIFATTHLPSILDPALRRPGRLDETLMIPHLPNFQHRFGILKSELSTFSSTLDFMDFALLFEYQTQQQMHSVLSKLKRSLFTLPTGLQESAQDSFSRIFAKMNLYSQNSDSLIAQFEHKKVQNSPNGNESYLPKFDFRFSLLKANLKKSASTLPKPISTFSQNISDFIYPHFLSDIGDSSTFLHSQKDRMSKLERSSSFQSASEDFAFWQSRLPSKTLSITYAQISQLCVRAHLFQNVKSFKSLFWTRSSGQEFSENSIYLNLYERNENVQNMICQWISPKIGELFAYNSFSNSRNNFRPEMRQKGLLSWNLDLVQNMWRESSTLLFSVFQKRYLYSKNSIAFKFLDLENLRSFREAPSPSASTLFTPAKRFENFKRHSKAFQSKFSLNLQQKIYYHQEQRLSKKLYEQPLSKTSLSRSLTHESTNLERSFIELQQFQSSTIGSSASILHYRGQFLMRHRFYTSNLWWNGQLAEANAEKTYLSDVDWRSLFIPSLGDVLLDFPDADQHYNARKRRWILSQGAPNFPFSFDHELISKIRDHYLTEAVSKLYSYFDQNREILDSLSFQFLRKGFIHRMDLDATLARFYAFSSDPKNFALIKR